ncbi:MAG TPA: HEAT repeat domain-containing protein [Longimicrobiaceae bacterium]|nr:HEAT repeat domain-containing protein [Longimicrobiaceae bacterium]
MLGPTARHRFAARPAARLSVLPALLALGACTHGARPALFGPAHFEAEVRSMVGVEQSSPQYPLARARLESMGPEVDAVLVLLARDPDARLTARVNAITALADRRSPAAMSVLRHLILAEGDDDVRAAAVLALDRLAQTEPAAENLIRAAVADPAPIVRLDALQALDARDVGVIRAVLETEDVPGVRKVARELVALAESRGAPLASDRRGALRTTGAEDDPQIVFRPVRTDSVTRTAFGDMRVELPNAADIPLAPLAEVVGGVVPAFFSPDRGQVVYEADREIRVVDLATRAVSNFGSGVAPRPIPFSNRFVFLRLVQEKPFPGTDSTRLVYDVYRAGFDGRGAPERLGELHAIARQGRHGNYSPVRWMVVTDSPAGYVLSSKDVESFTLPVEPLPAGPASGPRRPWRHSSPRGGPL